MAARMVEPAQSCSKSERQQRRNRMRIPFHGRARALLSVLTLLAALLMASDARAEKASLANPVDIPQTITQGQTVVFSITYHGGDILREAGVKLRTPAGQTISLKVPD